MYYIYHIPGVKIGCTNNLERRIREQKFAYYKLLETYLDKFSASNRERELQKQYGYRLDSIPYNESLKRIKKAQEVSLATKNEWLPNIDWKAREAKIDKDAKWNKVKSHPNYINMDRKACNASWKLKKVLIQYDLNGNFIKEWNCGVRNMPDEYKNAGGCAKTNKGTLYGYQWRYKTSENYSKQIGSFQNQMWQKIVQKDLKGNIIKIWDNQQQAANELKCSIQLISQNVKGKNKTAKGFIWEKYV
jgi:hypothetical protein